MELISNKDDYIPDSRIHHERTGKDGKSERRFYLNVKVASKSCRNRTERFANGIRTT